MQSALYALKRGFMVTLYIYENASKSKTTIYRDTHRTKNRSAIGLKIQPLLLKIKLHIGLKIRYIGLKIACSLIRAIEFV